MMTDSKTLPAWHFACTTAQKALPGTHPKTHNTHPSPPDVLNPLISGTSCTMITMVNQHFTPCQTQAANTSLITKMDSQCPRFCHTKITLHKTLSSGNKDITVQLVKLTAACNLQAATAAADSQTDIT
jgi:hypothetical protein